MSLRDEDWPVMRVDTPENARKRAAQEAQLAETRERLVREGAIVEPAAPQERAS